MRLGLFGGTFDPVHYGHLLLAEQCREQCELDQVWLIPAGRPPHKVGETMTHGPARAEMLKLAVAGDPRFSVCPIELEGDEPSYTYQTLERIQAEDAARELHFLIGADSLADLAIWRKPERIAELATIVAVNRGSRPLPDMSGLTERLGEQVVSRIRIVEMPGIDLSATEIRSRVREGRSIRFMTPRAVEAYIAENSLYGSESP